MGYAEKIARYPQVQGQCPTCHGKTLFLGEGGYVTCSYLSCPNPSAANHYLLDGKIDPKPVYETLLDMGFKKDDLDYAINEARSDKKQS